MRNPIKIQTNSSEIYEKLPLLRYHNEIIFSKNVGERALSKIINNLRKNGLNIELHKFNDRFVLIKKNYINFNFDVYLKS